MTLKTDGGIAGYFLNSEYQQDLYNNENFTISARSVVEFTYVFIVISLLFSIITGIIIDTFGLLRDEAD